MKVAVALLALALVVPAAAARKPAPTISGTTLDGKKVSLAEFRGRPVIVNIWSSW